MSANSMKFISGIITEGFSNANISLIKSDELRLKLYSISTMVEFVRKTEEIEASDINDIFSTFLYDNYNYRNMDKQYSRDKGLIGNTKFTDFNN